MTQHAHEFLIEARWCQYALSQVNTALKDEICSLKSAWLLTVCGTKPGEALVLLWLVILNLITPRRTSMYLCRQWRVDDGKMATTPLEIQVRKTACHQTSWQFMFIITFYEILFDTVTTDKSADGDSDTYTLPVFKHVFYCECRCIKKNKTMNEEYLHNTFHKCWIIWFVFEAHLCTQWFTLTSALFKEDLFAVRMTFLPKLKTDLVAFMEGWNNHPLRTEGNRTPPEQIWPTGIMRQQINQPENLEVVFPWRGHKIKNHFLPHLC